MTQRSASLVTMTEHLRDDGLLVRISGRLDRRSVADLRLVLHRLAGATGTSVLIDLDEAVIGDASAVGLLVELRRRAQRTGTDLRIVAADERSMRLLHRARLGALLAPGLRPPRPARLALAGTG